MRPPISGNDRGTETAGRRCLSASSAVLDDRGVDEHSPVEEAVQTAL
jgi:hypothetical protein